MENKRGAVVVREEKNKQDLEEIRQNKGITK